MTGHSENKYTFMILFDLFEINNKKNIKNTKKELACIGEFEINSFSKSQMYMNIYPIQLYKKKNPKSKSSHLKLIPSLFIKQ